MIHLQPHKLLLIGGVGFVLILISVIPLLIPHRMSMAEWQEKRLGRRLTEKELRLYSFVGSDEWMRQTGRSGYHTESYWVKWQQVHDSRVLEVQRMSQEFLHLYAPTDHADSYQTPPTLSNEEEMMVLMPDSTIFPSGSVQ